MGRLQKNMDVAFVPGVTGVDAVLPKPAVPAYCTSKTVVVVDTVVSSMPADEYTDRDPDTSLVLGGGYYTPWPTNTSVTQYEREEIITKCYPAQPAVVGVPGVPPVAAQIIKTMNYGWNSWARSVDPVTLGSYYIFKVPVGVMGVFIGLDVQGLLGRPTSYFKHGLVIDLSGIRVLEGGSVKTILKGNYLYRSRIRVVRQADNTIVYVVSTDSDTALFVSQVPPLLAQVSLYLYGYLYRTGDEVHASEIRSREVQFRSV